MKISEALWGEIRAAVEAAVAKSNDFLEQRNGHTRQRVRVVPMGPEHEVLLRESYDVGEFGRGQVHERKAVAFNHQTGEVRKCSVKQARGSRLSVSVKGSDPKAWAKLLGKPASEFIEKLGLHMPAFAISEVRPAGTTRMEDDGQGGFVMVDYDASVPMKMDPETGRYEPTVPVRKDPQTGRMVPA